MTCQLCDNPSGFSLVCRTCLRQLKPKSSTYERIMRIWHDLITETGKIGDDYFCFHCGGQFPRDEVIGDHFPFTRARRPDLVMDIRNGKCSCKGCNQSGSPFRKNAKDYLPLDPPDED